MSEIILSVEQLRKTYRKTASQELLVLDDVNINLR